MPMENPDHILIMKTDIATAREARLLELLFSVHPAVKHWSVDLEDVDRILRIVSPTLAYTEVAALLRPCGFYCCELK